MLPQLRRVMWQRGISLYYLNRFEEAAKQFKKDTESNPNDSEEAIWNFLAEAQTLGIEQARERFLPVRSCLHCSFCVAGMLRDQDETCSHSTCRIMHHKSIGVVASSSACVCTTDIASPQRHGTSSVPHLTDCCRLHLSAATHRAMCMRFAPIRHAHQTHPQVDHNAGRPG